jgi:hypothetical protein
MRCEIFTVALMRGIERACDGGRGMRKLWKRTETLKVVWLENLKERYGSKCIGINWREISKWTLKERDERV